MALSRSDIYTNGDLLRIVKRQSSGMLTIADKDPRLSAAFATQQRWLMSHVGLALYFRGLVRGTTSGLHFAKYLDAIVEAKIASRNTADSYIKEMIQYKYVKVHPSSADRRIRPFSPAPHALAVVNDWVRLHLHSLDCLDGGSRLQVYENTPNALYLIQPPISDALIAANAVRNPTGTFSLFTWLDNGGTIMDWLMANMEDMPMSAERVPVGEISTVEMATRLSLSRTHLARKLREAEAMGSIGWEGRRGHSVMWVSRGFREEYADAQAVKLAIIDQAFTFALSDAAIRLGLQSVTIDMAV
jgi:hypothetical protein